MDRLGDHESYRHGFRRARATSRWTSAAWRPRLLRNVHGVGRRV